MIGSEEFLNQMVEALGKINHRKIGCVAPIFQKLGVK